MKTSPTLADRNRLDDQRRLVVAYVREQERWIADNPLVQEEREMWVADLLKILEEEPH